jgi:hypothetical protein
MFCCSRSGISRSGSGSTVRSLAGARSTTYLTTCGRNSLPVVDQRRQRLGELQRRVGVVALADAHRDRLAGIPALLLGLLEALRFHSGEGSTPVASPGRSMPVRSPKPKGAMKPAMPSMPRSLASW